MTADADPSSSRVRRLRLLLVVVLGTVFAAFAARGASSYPLTPTSDSPSETVQLSTDAGSGPMFSVPAMSPDQTGTNCLEVRYSGVVQAASVRLYATDGGALAPYLHMTAEAGVGGRYDDCSDFTGSTVYQGTLADFLSAHGTFASGLPVFELPDASGTRAMRFTFTLDSDAAAQGLADTATFYWAAVDTPPTPVPTPTSVPPSATPSPSATDQPSAAGSSSVPGPSRSGTPMPRHTPAAGGPTAGPNRPTPTFLDQLGGSALAATRFATRNFGFLGGLLVIILAFLAVQDRIDGRDPKLARAPVTPPPDLRFTDPEEAVP